MTIVVVPPLTDATVRPMVDPQDELLDLNQGFTQRVGDPAFLSRFGAILDEHEVAGHADLPVAQRCLLVLAAADALGEPADGTTRLRALGAAIRAVSAGDPALTATLDDVELRRGSTQSSAAVARAALECQLFDRELDAAELALAERSAGEAVELVVDVDQQLPAAFALVTRLRGRRELVLSGRFVAAHARALGRTQALTGVRLVDRIRPRTVSVDGGDVVWATASDEVPSTGPWAGWLDAGPALQLADDAWTRCVGVVVSASGPGSGTCPAPAGSGEAGSGAAGSGAAGSGLAEVLPRLAERIPVALEVVIGGPGAAAVRPEAPWWQPWGAGVRLAGFRPYRRPLPRSGTAGATAGQGADDLARWAPDDSGPAEVGAVLDAFCDRDLFPGRVAGALFATEPRAALVQGYVWDPAVRPVHLERLSPDDRGPGDFLVSLRTGRLSRVQPSLGRLIGRLRARGSEAFGAQLPDGRRDEVLAGLCRTGLVRRVTAA